MKTCTECGRPIPLCNAFTLNRLATEALQLGRVEQAVRYAAAAVEACEPLRDIGPPAQRTSWHTSTCASQDRTRHAPCDCGDR